MRFRTCGNSNVATPCGLSISANPATKSLTPADPAPAGGALTRAQVQEAIDALDLRFSKGEISEDTYNRMSKKWEERLKELGG